MHLGLQSYLAFHFGRLDCLWKWNIDIMALYTALCQNCPNLFPSVQDIAHTVLN